MLYHHRFQHEVFQPSAKLETFKFEMEPSSYSNVAEKISSTSTFLDFPDASISFLL